jgi:thiol-disulfide isomerase/thioredoxin
MKRTLLLLLALTLAASAFSEDDFHCYIQLTLKSKVFKTITMRRTGISLNPRDTKELVISPSKGYQRIAIPREGLYRIGDGWAGHTIYITSGDSIKMVMTDRPNGLDDNVTFQFCTLKVQAKYPGNYSFYDELRQKHRMTNRELNENSVHFKLRCDSILLVGNALLQNYYKQGIISPRFKLLAEEEIKAQYVGWMCTILSDADRNNFTTSYGDALGNFHFTNSTYAVEGNEYTQAAYLITMYISNRYFSGYSDSVCRRDFESIANTYSGVLRDKLMAWHIQDNAEHNTACFDSVYHAFQELCQSNYIKKGCMRKVEEIRADMKKTDNLSLGDILDKSFVVDVKGKRRSISSTLADSIPTIIDCWATWCGPCREQMPYIHAIEKQYKGKVQLVYISLDDNGKKWVDFLRSKKQHAPNTFRIVDSDNAPFLSAMRLKTIPRFILIRKGDADVLNAWLPMPSDTKNFEQALKPYVR